MEGVKKLFLRIAAPSGAALPLLVVLLGMWGSSGPILDVVQGQFEPEPTPLDQGTGLCQVSRSGSISRSR
jgi:hypothetical protein